jgi:hypothetical protein
MSSRRVAEMTIFAAGLPAGETKPEQHPAIIEFLRHIFLALIEEGCHVFLRSP